MRISFIGPFYKGLTLRRKYDLLSKYGFESIKFIYVCNSIVTANPASDATLDLCRRAHSVRKQEVFSHSTLSLTARRLTCHLNSPDDVEFYYVRKIEGYECIVEFVSLFEIHEFVVGLKSLTS